MTKKAAALLLAASLAVSVCATPVFAADHNMGSQTVNSSTNVPGGALVGVGNTDVFYKVTESYTWTVPATIDFGENAGVGNTSTVNATLGKDELGKMAVKDSTDNKWKGTAPKIMVTKNVIGVGKNLKIAVSPDWFDTNGEFYVETPDTYEKLYFTITKPAATGGTGTKLTETENEVLSVPSGTNTAGQELVFTLNTTPNNTAGNAAEMAGSYEGHVVFYSSIV